MRLKCSYRNPYGELDSASYELSADYAGKTEREQRIERLQTLRGLREYMRQSAARMGRRYQGRPVVELVNEH